MGHRSPFIVTLDPYERPPLSSRAMTFGVGLENAMPSLMACYRLKL
ncbi:hypothetical protein COLO4_26430 [Corchorus olitorius]|uniref:Uncharacterized protein n=1 Tax=Corchorus olitorius TaxID=93759 RepID=A0A1R3HX63_9ROSI|nr:hypothetical protein COLO4_26430 [Corchorus olitorius]